MKRVVVFCIGALLSLSVLAAPNYREYANDMEKSKNKKMLNDMEQACKPVNKSGLQKDPVKCKELVNWQLKKQCQYGILSKDQCKGL